MSQPPFETDDWVCYYPENIRLSGKKTFLVFPYGGRDGYRPMGGNPGIGETSVVLPIVLLRLVDGVGKPFPLLFRLYPAKYLNIRVKLAIHWFFSPHK